MNSLEQIKDIKVATKELNKIIIKGIIEYLKNGTLLNNTPNTYFNAYTIVSQISIMGDKESEALYEFHNKTIQKFIEDC